MERRKCRDCDAPFRYKCGKCRKIYQSLQSLRSHQKYLCYNAAPLLYCNDCSYKNRVKGNLVVHMLSSHADPSLIKTHKCSKCSNTYKFRHHMLHHERLCGEHNLLQCQSCSYTANGIHRLRVHVRNLHSKPKFPTCKGFKRDQCLEKPPGKEKES